MVKVAKQTELDILVQFVYKQNNNPQYYSAYMPKARDAIYQELKTSTERNQVLTVTENRHLVGVLVFYISPNNTVDVAGPFVIEDNLTIAKALINHCIKCTKHRNLNFFFADTCDFYKTLMSHYGAHFNDYEYIMKCSPNTFQAYPQTVPISKAQEEEKDNIIAIHQRVFKDTYITRDMLVDDNRYNHLYVYKDGNNVAGLSLMMNKENYTYIETFGLIVTYRGKGLSKPFLSTLMQYAFNNNHATYIMLVVDEVNTIAAKLYKALGFVVEHYNVSYTLVLNDHNNKKKEG